MTLPHPGPPVQHQRTWRCTALRLAGAVAVAPSAPHEPGTRRGRWRGMLGVMPRGG